MAANTITDKAELLKGLKCIREKGYAIDDGESDNGLRCAAAPIFNHLGETKFAVSVTGPAIRLTENRLDLIVETIKNAVREISYRLGYIE